MQYWLALRLAFARSTSAQAQRSASNCFIEDALFILLKYQCHNETRIVVLAWRPSRSCYE